MLLKELKNNSALAEEKISGLAKRLGFGLRNVQASCKAPVGQTWIGATFTETAKAEFKGKNKWFPEVGYRVYISFTFKSNKFSMRAWYFDASNRVNPIGDEHYELISSDMTIADTMADMKEHFDACIKPELDRAMQAYRDAK